MDETLVDLLGDHLSYVLLVVFGLFAVGVHAYSSFGQQIPGDASHQGNALLDSLSVLSLGGQYSVFRGLVFYLVVSESLYIILASSTMILQLTLNAMGREDMAGALSSGVELNPLIPILASSVIISASQIKPLSQIEHSIRRIGHRIAGIPRNVYEIQERIKATPLNTLKRQSLGQPIGSNGAEELSLLTQCARNAQNYALQMVNSIKGVGLRATERQQFQRSLQNVRYLHDLAKLAASTQQQATAEHLEVQEQADQFLEGLEELQITTMSAGVDELADEHTSAWSVEIQRGYEVESELIRVLCLQLFESQAISQAALEIADPMRQARLKISSILQQREQTSTMLYERASLATTLGNVYRMRDTLARLDVSMCRHYQDQIVKCNREIISLANTFDSTVESMIGQKSAQRSANNITESDWAAFFVTCQRLEADLISTLSLFLADRVEDQEVSRLNASSKIASYAENKAELFANAGAVLELSQFRLDGFRRSLEKVFCLYEWTLGTDGRRIWATHDTQQITLLFESIKHKFDAFENDLNELVAELGEAAPVKKESSIKSRWKDAINRCSSLEDDLTILLALLLINKPDVQLRNYPLLDRLRDYVLERDHNHEMNAFGMSALFGLFLSLALLTFHFSFVDDIKGSFRLPDGGVPAPNYSEVSLGPVFKDYEVREDRNLLLSVFGQYLSEGGVRASQREASQTYILDLIGSTAGSFLDACLEVLDYLIIFVISTGIALTIRSMRKVERRWATRSFSAPPPMYSYMFVGMVAYLVSACFILLYRFVRIVVMPMLDSQANLLSSAHLTLFRDSFSEYLLFPATAFVIVWYVLAHMDRKDNPGVWAVFRSALKFALLCTLINVVGKVLSDSFKTGWDVVNFLVLPTLGFFSFLIMFAYCMKRYRIVDGLTGDTMPAVNLDDFFGVRGFGSGGGAGAGGAATASATVSQSKDRQAAETATPETV